MNHEETELRLIGLKSRDPVVVSIAKWVGVLSDKQKAVLRGAKERQSEYSSLCVAYPDGISEFEIHATLWVELRKRKLDARCHVVSKFLRSEICTFDICLFDNRKLVRIIEVKNGSTTKEKWEKTRQARRYRAYGVPVDVVIGLDGVKAYLRDLDIKAGP